MVADSRGLMYSLKRLKSPIVVSLILGSTSKPLPPDLRVQLGSYMAKSSDTYSGANTFKALNTNPEFRRKPVQMFQHCSNVLESLGFLVTILAAREHDFGAFAVLPLCLVACPIEGL